MKIEFYKLDLLEEANLLSNSQQIAFAASICERLLPNYKIFAKESNWNTFPLLRTALDNIWLLAEGETIDDNMLRQLLANCQKIVPSSEDNNFSSRYVPEAQSASAAVCYSLELCLEKKQKLVKMVVLAAHATLWGYLGWQMEVAEDNAEGESDNDWSKKNFQEQQKLIINHPFTVREIAKENEDLQILKETPILTKEFIRRFRDASNPTSRSIIDVLIE